ncbi:MAG: O-antigen ligase family protein [Armatimonadetes bacterium]|nr:O-antigen ligase family protein [Armatimonadota bacterium]MDI9584770.1 O-antigen ligase family protein [Acidobacteriota bacterium]
MVDNTAPQTKSAASGMTGLELAALILIVLSCSQIGYVGHPRYGPFIAVADVFCAGLFVVWLAVSLRRRGLRELPWPCEPILAWIAVGALSISVAATDATGAISLSGVKNGIIEVAQLGLYFVGAYMIFVDAFKDRACLRRAFLVLLAATSGVVLWGLIDYITRSDVTQVKASFGNRNVYSAFLVMVVPLLFGFFIYDRSSGLKAWATCLFGIAALTMLGPPHVWIMTGLVAWVAFLRGRWYRTALAPALVAFAVLVTLAVPRNRAANVTELLDPFEREDLYKLEATMDLPEGDEAPEDPEASEMPPETGPDVLVVKKRWLEWQPALAMMSDNVALGVGAGSYQRRIGEAVYYGSLPNVKKSEPDTNNLYLVVGASMGFGGLVALIAALAWHWRRATRLWLRAGERLQLGLAIGLPASVMGIALANLFTSLFVRGSCIIWALVFAITVVATAHGGQESSDNARQG